jgi:hypothetical protein
LLEEVCRSLWRVRLDSKDVPARNINHVFAAKQRNYIPLRIVQILAFCALCRLSAVEPVKLFPKTFVSHYAYPTFPFRP